MRTYIKDANFDIDSGISTVTIDSKYGTFSGTCRCHDSDMPKASRFFGCKIAELRAYKKAMKSQLHDYKVEYKVMRSFVDTLSQMRNFDPKSAGYYHAKKSMRIIAAKIENQKKNLEAIDAYIKNCITERDNIDLNRFADKKD